MHHSNQNQIKLTVNSTIQTGTSNSSGATHSVETNICKQEPKEENHCIHTATSQHPTHPTSAANTTNSENLATGDVDIEALLNTLRDHLPDTALSELDKEASKTLDNSTKDTLEKKLLTDNVQRLAGISQNTNRKVNGLQGRIYGNADTGYDPATSVSQQVLPSMGGMAANTQSGMIPGYSANARQSVNPVHNSGNGVTGAPSGTPILGDTGPAAETLKQLAAQHQNQEVQQYENLKTSQINYEGFSVNSQGHFSGYSGQQYPSMHSMTPQQSINGMYYNNQQTSPHMTNYIRPNRPMAAYDRSSKDLSYNTTKPLSHYPTGHDGQSPSSLQQLQNQVQSHFNQSTGDPELPPGAMPGQSHNLHISQQMNMTNSGQRMHLSQTQHLDIHSSNRQNLSVGQQQSFHMGENADTGGNMQNHQYMSDQMYKQQQQQHNPAGIPMPQPGTESAANMGYMNRPPPDYKPPAGFPAPSGANVGCTIGSTASGTTNNNPLETMQNMVNQASPVSSGDPNMYPLSHTNIPMKREPCNPADQLHCTSPMVPLNTHVSTPTHPTMSTTICSSATTKGGRPRYTSAIMKNQRAPNVNVGPHGLNISQQRVPQIMDWSHRGPSVGMRQQNMMAGAHSGHMNSMHQGNQMQSSAATHRMMQYSSGSAPGYHNGRMAHSAMARTPMYQPNHQSMVIHSGQHQNMASMTQPSGNNMMHMQQQQHIQMHQAGAGRSRIMQPGVIVSPEQIPNADMSTGVYPTHGIGQDYNNHQQHFVPAAQHPQHAAAPPYIDIMQQQASTSSEFLDEILGNKPC